MYFKGLYQKEEERKTRDVLTYSAMHDREGTIQLLLQQNV